LGVHTNFIKDVSADKEVPT